MNAKSQETRVVHLTDLPITTELDKLNKV